MEKVYRVAVVAGNSAYDAKVIRGVLSCPRHPHSVIFAVWNNEVKFEPFIRRWRPDGIIAHFPNHKFAKKIQAFGVPTINIGDPIPQAKTDVLRVGIDDRAVGEMAAHYFLQRGFRNFGFSHYPDFPFSTDRYAGFSDALRRAGGRSQSVDEQPLHHYKWGHGLYNTDDSETNWLKSLPKPVAILAANDVVGARLLDSCREANLRVPGDIAVMGVDNDELTCQVNPIPLSSIETPTVQVGFQTMVLMKRLLKSEKLAEKTVLLPPLRVVERQSSDKLSVDDALLAAVIRYIRDHISEPIGVDQVAAGVMMSRRQLEMRFRAVLHRSPADQIRRERFEQTRQMLLETNLSITEIAERVGLMRADQLFEMFRREYQMTPSAYRNKFRSTPNPLPAPGRSLNQLRAKGEK